MYKEDRYIYICMEMIILNRVQFINHITTHRYTYYNREQTN